MLKCWDEQPHKRPTFKELRSQFDAMLLADKKDEYIDLRVDHSKSYYQNLSPPVTNSEGGRSSSMSLKTRLMSAAPKSHSKEYLSNPATSRDLSPSSSVNTVDRDSSREHLISERQTRASSAERNGTSNRIYENTGRPVSMYISREEKKRQNPYVDEPSKVAATALTLPNNNGWPEHWGSEGVLMELNRLENVEQWSREQNCPEIQICPCEEKK